MKKQVKPVKQTNGALSKKLSVYDIVGINHSPYSVTNVEEYRTQLGMMHPSDLTEHAMKVGVAPLDNREQLLTLLERKFVQYQGLFQSEIRQKGDSMTKKDRAVALEILKNGK